VEDLIVFGKNPRGHYVCIPALFLINLTMTAKLVPDELYNKTWQVPRGNASLLERTESHGYWEQIKIHVLCVKVAISKAGRQRQKGTNSS
jgi:hypothetical protein